MKFCCEKFRVFWDFNNQSYPNIRVVKMTSNFLVNDKIIEIDDMVFKRKDKHRVPYRYFITWGYNTFSFDMITLNIDFCPFCGENLYKFYSKDEYVNEVEGETFKL